MNKSEKQLAIILIIVVGVIIVIFNTKSAPPREIPENETIIIPEVDKSIIPIKVYYIYNQNYDSDYHWYIQYAIDEANIDRQTLDNRTYKADIEAVYVPNTTFEGDSMNRIYNDTEWRHDQFNKILTKLIETTDLVKVYNNASNRGVWFVMNDLRHTALNYGGLIVFSEQSLRGSDPAKVIIHEDYHSYGCNHLPIDYPNYQECIMGLSNYDVLTEENLCGCSFDDKNYRKKQLIFHIGVLSSLSATICSTGICIL